jgi:hypothetical protein
MDEIAIKFNISSRTLYNYLKFLRSKDLVCDHATNLMLKSIKLFIGNQKAIIRIDNSHDLFDVTCLLYCKLIEQKAKQQAFAESARRFGRGRGDRDISIQSESPFLPSLSSRTIAKLLNVSEFKAFQVTKNLVRLGVIKTEKQKPQLVSKNFTALECVEDMPGYRYNVGTNLFEIFGARIEFMQFPVYLKKISLKQYLSFMKSYFLIYAYKVVINFASL